MKNECVYGYLFLQVIKSAIEQHTLDDLRSKESVSVRSVLPADVNVANVLKVLTTERYIYLVNFYYIYFIYYLIKI